MRGGDGLNRKHRKDRAADVSPANQIGHNRETCQRAKPTQAGIAERAVRQVKEAHPQTVDRPMVFPLK